MEEVGSTSELSNLQLVALASLTQPINYPKMSTQTFKKKVITYFYKT